jgi:hypothetical protein
VRQTNTQGQTLQPDAPVYRTRAQDGDTAEYQIRTISSGTLGSVAGLKRYDEIDALRHSWLTWARSQGCPWFNWQQAWNAYAAAGRPVTA